MFVRGICAEKSDVEVGHFEGEMRHKGGVMYRDDREMSRDRKHDWKQRFMTITDGRVVVLVSSRVMVIAMSSREDLAWRSESEASSKCFAKWDAEGAWDTMRR